MKVSLIEFTGSGRSRSDLWAAAVLCSAKDTRLTMDPDSINKHYYSFTDAFAARPAPTGQYFEDHAEMIKQLSAIADTIPSCWEFLDTTFLFQGCTRAFTHQLVRTRTASFAQQTMRVLDVDGWDYMTGPSIQSKHQLESYESCMDFISATYNDLIDSGANIEDARGVLPTNIRTNIMMKMNFRTLVDLVRKRSSPRVQGEYREAVEGIVSEVLKVWPWASLFIDRDVDHYFKDLENDIKENVAGPTQEKMLKAIHKIREGGK